MKTLHFIKNHILAILILTCRDIYSMLQVCSGEKNSAYPTQDNYESQHINKTIYLSLLCNLTFHLFDQIFQRLYRWRLTNKLHKFWKNSCFHCFCSQVGVKWEIKKQAKCDVKKILKSKMTWNKLSHGWCFWKKYFCCFFLETRSYSVFFNYSHSLV